ncbi:MAG: hypothetical protein HYY85_03435 [Deltaproteobacteria bacterium]|nr:hypothetical protein [Deltaproteobacteria bacterium]
MLSNRYFHIVLAVALLGAIYYNIRTFTRPRTPARAGGAPAATPAQAPGPAAKGAPQSPAAQAGTPGPSSGPVDPWASGKHLASGEGFGRNPFFYPGEEAAAAQPAKAPAQPTEALSTLVLTGIIQTPGRRLAIINGKAMAEGDQIGAEKILEVRPTEVVLGRGAERRSLPLGTKREVQIRTIQR